MDSFTLTVGLRVLWQFTGGCGNANGTEDRPKFNITSCNVVCMLQITYGYKGIISGIKVCDRIFFFYSGIPLKIPVVRGNYESHP